MRYPILVGMLAVVLGSGCAGVSPTHMGQTAGTIAGAAIAPGVGAPLGALVGLLTGLLLQGKIDQVTEVRERKELGEQLTGGGSSSSEAESLVSAPQGELTRVWVDETVNGGRLIAGHFDSRLIP